jgi:hypothetical protein
MIADLIHLRFHVDDAPRYVCHLLDALGFSYQKEKFAAAHLDNEAALLWLEETWPQVLRVAKEKRAVILFGDEDERAALLRVEGGRPSRRVAHLFAGRPRLRHAAAGLALGPLDRSLRRLAPRAGIAGAGVTARRRGRASSRGGAA